MKTALPLVTAAGLVLGAFSAFGLPFKEVNGVVCVEAEHFDSRQKAIDDDHHWVLVPDEGPSTYGYKNARGGKFLQVQPDSGQNRNNADAQALGPTADYKVEIKTTGEYRLWLRAMGFDGSSDSLYAQILELRSDNGGPGPNWYRKAPTPQVGDFAALNGNIGWDGNGGAEVNSGDAGGDPMLFTISKPGVYTVRVQQREDGLGFDGFVLQLSSKPDPAQDIPEYPSESNFVLINKQPGDVRIGNGGPASFSVDATGSAAVTIQWQRAAPNGTVFADISGATSTTYTSPSNGPAENGAHYRAKLGIPGKDVFTREAAIIVDITPPAITKVRGNASFNGVTVVFSESIDSATGGNASNYKLSDGLSVTTASLSTDGTTATLTTSAQAVGTKYTLTVSNMKDVVSPPNVISPNPTSVTFSSYVIASGAVGFEAYNDIGGTPIQGLLDSPKFPNQPDFTATSTSFDSRPIYPNDSHDNYGGRMRALLTPTESGDYNFFLRSDDASQLFVSTNESFPDPTSATPDAEETGCCDPFKEPGDGVAETSQAITLKAGKKYAIVVLWKEGGGGDYAQVAWRKAGDTTPASTLTPIPGKFLSWYVDPGVTLNITQQPASTSVAASAPVTLSVRYSAESFLGSSANIQWQKASKGSSSFSDIAGATSVDYTIPFADPADNGAKFRAVASISTLASVNSDEAVLTVGSESTPPTIVAVAGSAQAITVAFSEPLDDASATSKGNYSIDKGVTVNKATLISAANTAGVVQLELNGASAGNLYTLFVSNVKDRSGNSIAGTARVPFVAYNAYYNFNAGLPDGTKINGSAAVVAGRGPDGSGALMLTPATGGQQGSFITPDVSGGAAVAKFVANFKLYIGNGSGNAADGFSFVVSEDLADESNFGEEGTGNGLIIALDTYDNGNAEAPSIDVKYKGQEVASKKSPPSKATLVNSRWVDVQVRLYSNGTVDVIHDGVKYHDKVQLPDFAPFSAPRFGIGARTGGEFELHIVDNFSVLANADPVELPKQITISNARRDGDVIEINWTGGTAPFLVEGTSSLTSPSWIALVTTTTSSARIPLASPSGFLRVTDNTTRTVKLYRAALNGSNEKPTAVDTTGTGIGLLAVEGVGAGYILNYSNLKGNATLAHIHGPADVNASAGVMVGFSNPSGSAGVISGIVALTAQQAADIAAGKAYFNLHSTVAPGGEIRGQLVAP